MNELRNQQLALLSGLMKKAEKSLNDKPAGFLQICKNKNTSQFYYHAPQEPRKGIYVSKKKEMSFIRAMAQKSYDQKFLAVAVALQKDLQNTRKPYEISNMHDFYQYLASVYQDLTPDRQKLVTPHVMPDEMYVKAWLDFPYEGKGFDKKDPIIKSKRGERVRSKSEKIIADMLLEMQLPYRFEFPLKTKRLGIIFPDLTLLDLWNRRMVIFEHFGRMQDDGYCIDTMTKLEVYEEEGFKLGRDFLFTMESKDHMVDFEHFKRLIRDRFPYLPYFSTQSHG